jgi:Transmembrane domain of unknown function (DUF3566)
VPTLDLVSPSERRAVEVGEADATAASPEPASAFEAALDSTLDKKSRADVAPTPDPVTSAVRPVDIPEIIPATLDVPSEPEPSRSRTPAPPLVVEQDPPVRQVVTSPRHDPLDTWHDAANAPIVVPIPVVAGGRSTAFRGVSRRPRVRKVTRVVRHIDPWSTFKVALIFSIVLYGVLLTAGVLLWNVASNTGTVDNVERWFTQFGWESYELKGGEIFHNAWIAGLFGVVGLTGLAVLGATLFNLISDMVGGVRVTVLEEEVIEHTTSRSDRFVIRRPPDGPAPVAEFDLEGDLDVPANGARTGASRPSSVTPPG